MNIIRILLLLRRYISYTDLGARVLHDDVPNDSCRLFEDDVPVDRNRGMYSSRWPRSSAYETDGRRFDVYETALAETRMVNDARTDSTAASYDRYFAG